MSVLAIVLLVAAAPQSGPDATSVRGSAPPLSGDAAHAVARRAPLRPEPLLELPLGAVEPRGWLRACLERQRDGLTGGLGEISAWLQKEDNAWLDADGRGAWGWEEVPYWLKGYGEIAELLDDDAMRAEARTWIEGALASQRADGSFGPVRRFGDDGSQDFWANMVMISCLRAHHEATGDPRVLELLLRYSRHLLEVPDELFLTHYWQRMRGGDQLLHTWWLYDRTGEPWLLELGRKLHRNTADWGRHGELPDGHNVNIAQGFREPAGFSALSHDRADLDASYAAFRRVREEYGQVPGGMFGSDENCRPGFDDPRQGIETCGVVEQMASDAVLLRQTADPFWADHAEEVAFNTWPVSFTPDHRALRYFTSPNHVVSDAADHAPGIQNSGPFLAMNPLSHRCCQHNHSHGWSSFTRSLWAATLDGGLCAALLAPSAVEARAGAGAGTAVRIEVATRYPFEEELRFRVEPAAPVVFPLYLRVPGWCRGASLELNGAPLGASAPGGAFVRIERRWRAGDTVVLRLPMEVEVERWPANHDAASVRRGPLVYSLDIPERVVRRRADETAVHDSKWQEGVDLEAWPAFELFAAAPWNYGLLLDEADPASGFRLERRAWPADDYPFERSAAPLVLRGRGRRIPAWGIDRFGLAAELQDSPARSAEPDEELRLVPMGAARLRVSAFPVVARDPAAGVEWTPPALPQRLFEARASHCFGGDRVEAVADGLLPDHSGDLKLPRHTFWPHLGTAEWLEARFDAPRELRRVAVYWFDDEDESGGCRVPQSWRLSAWVDGAWRPLTPAGPPPGTARDRENLVEFPAVLTEALRIDVQLQPGASAGVLEWRVD